MPGITWCTKPCIKFHTRVHIVTNVWKARWKRLAPAYGDSITQYRFARIMLHMMMMMIYIYSWCGIVVKTSALTLCDAGSNPSGATWQVRWYRTETNPRRTQRGGHTYVYYVRMAAGPSRGSILYTQWTGLSLAGETA